MRWISPISNRPDGDFEAIPGDKVRNIGQGQGITAETRNGRKVETRLDIYRIDGETEGAFSTTLARLCVRVGVGILVKIFPKRIDCNCCFWAQR